MPDGEQTPAASMDATATDSSPQTPPPPVIPSPSSDHSNNNSNSHATPTNSEAQPTPPRSSEMLNLPRDFLSLRPQEPARVPTEQQQQQQQRILAPKFETIREETAGAALAATPKNSPLIVVNMASCCKGGGSAVPAVAVYPRALASHEEVLRDKELFLDTLRRLHGSLGFKSLTIPTIGGTQLDLHLLYKEVTARGGLHQVIKDRIWKEIKAVFHFPPTTTNASYVLRKYYSSLLHHYEQVYFFRNQGNVLAAPGDTSGGTGEFFSDDSDAIKRRRKRSYDSADSGNATNCIGQTVTGSIVGKFEHGYLVSVTVGNEALKGVLYNVPPGEYVPQFTTTAKLPISNGTPASDCQNPDGELRHKRRRRLGLRKKDPNAPKLNRSAYNFFFAEQRARIRLLQPNREISRMIGDSWSKLTDEQRLPYKQRGLVDKERYRKEINLYREKMRVLTSEADVESEIQANAEEAHDHEEEDVSDDPEQDLEPVEDNGAAPPEEQHETLEFKSILSGEA